MTSNEEPRINEALIGTDVISILKNHRERIEELESKATNKLGFKYSLGDYIATENETMGKIVARYQDDYGKHYVLELREGDVYNQTVSAKQIDRLIEESDNE